MVPSALSTPKAYLVKEVQGVIAWVILNHLNTQNSMTKNDLQEQMFILYHGITKDPKKIAFCRQCVHGVSVFEHLFVQQPADNIQRLTGSPTSPVRLRINPRLIPGLASPLYIGTGPTADIRYEHLEVASLSQANSDRRSLISGRTLLRMAMNVSRNLKNVQPIVMGILGPNGEMPSGKNDDDFFTELAKAVVDMKANGLLVDVEKEEETTTTTAVSTAETLTQGVQAVAKKKDADLKTKWSYKAIPAAGWFTVCLFVKNGIRSL